MIGYSLIGGDLLEQYFKATHLLRAEERAVMSGRKLSIGVWPEYPYGWLKRMDLRRTVFSRIETETVPPWATGPRR